jgi:hypothetical protein
VHPEAVAVEHIIHQAPDCMGVVEFVAVLRPPFLDLDWPAASCSPLSPSNRRGAQRREIDPPHIELAEPSVRRVETADGGGRSSADDEQPARIAARYGQQAIADLGRGPARGSSEPIEIIDQKRAIKRRLDTVTDGLQPILGRAVAAAKDVQLRRTYGNNPVAVACTRPMQLGHKRERD